MNLKPQTVYIPVDRQEIKEVPLFYVSEFRNKDWNYLSHTEKKENQICLSKEELSIIVNDASKLGMRIQRAISRGATIDSEYDIKQFINNLFNQ